MDCNRTNGPNSFWVQGVGSSNLLAPTILPPRRSARFGSLRRYKPPTRYIAIDGNVLHRGFPVKIRQYGCVAPSEGRASRARCCGATPDSLAPWGPGAAHFHTSQALWITHPDSELSTLGFWHNWRFRYAAPVNQFGVSVCVTLRENRTPVSGCPAIDRVNTIKSIFGVKNSLTP